MPNRFDEELQISMRSCKFREGDRHDFAHVHQGREGGGGQEEEHGDPFGRPQLPLILPVHLQLGWLVAIAT